jgi:DNA primase
MSNDSVAQVRQAIDLVELVSQTVAMKRRGRNFIGLCPFHQEKSPSFNVNPSRQTFYCFGCKAGGTAFDFVMKRDRVEFKDALEILARQAGIELPRFAGTGQKTGERQAMLDALSAACRFFENLLAQPQQGSAAREYLRKRGFTADTLKRFQVGLAADGWDALLKGPVGQKFSPQVLAQAGLIKPRESGEGYYDTFRNRIIFPIRNESGQIIAFGGRVMPGSTDPAKYLNSPETPLFSKSRAIFGLDLARQRIVETRTAAVVEGYTDVAMAHQFGALNVVSPLGTALTEPHVTILRRFADRIVLLFDADNAGDAAVDRVVQLFLTQPVEIAVATMPEGLDPDEFLLQQGLEAFNKLLASATDALDYAWKQLSRRFVSHEGDLTGQQKAAQEYLDLLAGARGGGPVDSMRWGAALARVSRLTEIPVAELHRRFKTPRHKPAKIAGPVASSEGSEAPASAAPVISGGRQMAERQLLGVLLIEPRRWHGVQLGLQAEEFEHPELRRLAETFWNHQRDEGEPVFNELLDLLPDVELKSLAIELVEAVEELNDLDGVLAGATQYLAEMRSMKEERKIVAEAQRIGGASDESQARILRELQERRRVPDLRRVGF